MNRKHQKILPMDWLVIGHLIMNPMYYMTHHLNKIMDQHYRQVGIQVVYSMVQLNLMELMIMH